MAQVTLVEGPSPLFQDSPFVFDFMGGSKGPVMYTQVETRTYKPDILINRCLDKWEKEESAMFQFPYEVEYGVKESAELVIAGIRKEAVPEGEKIILYLKVEQT